MNSIENIITMEEFEDIQKVEVDKTIVKSVSEKREGIVYRQLVMKALDIVKNQLQKEEKIEGYYIGRNYKDDTTRIMVAGTGFYAAHPIFDWSSKMILLKTNERLLIVETAEYFKYLKHYEVDRKIKIFKEKNNFYLETKDLKGIQKIIEYKMEDIDTIIDNLPKENVVIDNGKLKCIERDNYNKELLIMYAVPLVIFILFLIKWIF